MNKIIKRKKSAFTFLELLVVIAIIGISSFSLMNSFSDDNNSKLKSKDVGTTIYSFISLKSQQSATERDNLDIIISSNSILSNLENGSLDANLTISENFTYIVNRINDDNSTTNLPLPSTFKINKIKTFDQNIEILINDGANSLQQIKLYSLTGFIEKSHRNFENTGWIEE